MPYKPYLIRLAYSILALCALSVAFVLWFLSMLPAHENPELYRNTQAETLPYIQQATTEKRGKILAVLTSTSKLGGSGKYTGYELTELSRAYYVFKVNGFEVDIASPLGGEPPAVIDGDDIGEYDFAFLNDEDAQSKVKNSLRLSEVDYEQYDAVYFVGGKGAMFDFPDDPSIQRILKTYDREGKVIAAVCHGPAAFVNVKLDSGRSLVEGRKVSAFTNQEELLLIPDAESIFPFLLQTRLEENGANVELGVSYLKQISRDKNLITGQNPWSVWALADEMILALGYQPVPRLRSGEENTIDILLSYKNKGYKQAKAHLLSVVHDEHETLNHHLLAMHIMVAAMEFKFSKGFDYIRLLASAHYAS